MSPTIGVQDDGELLRPDELRGALLQNAQGMGARWVRAIVPYGKVRTQGGYDFSKYDGLISEAAKRGIRVQLTLTGTRDYDKAPGVSYRLSDRHPDSKVMGEFAKVAAQHFKGRVSRFSVWNEPNWNGTILAKDRPGAYRRLYDAAYKSIKSVDKRNQVLVGELAPGNENPNEHGAIPPLEFMSRMLKARKGPVRTDGVALHPYQGWGSPSKPGKTPEGYVGIGSLKRLADFQREAHRAGSLTTPMGRRTGMYLTEFGFKHDRFPDEAHRRELIGEAYREAAKAGAKQLVFYDLAPPDKPGWNTSIATRDGDLSGVAAVLRQARSQVRGRSSARVKGKAMAVAARRRPGRVATAMGGYGNVPGYGQVRNPAGRPPSAPKPVAFTASSPSRPSGSSSPSGPQDLPPDALYDDQIGGLQKRRDDALAAIPNAQTRTFADYGYSGSFDDKGGLTGLSFDPNNPFSRAALLRKSYQQSKAGTQNSMASRGQLYSGALERMQSANDMNYAQNENALQGGLRDALLGLADRRAQINTDYETDAGQALGARVGRANQSALYRAVTGQGGSAPAFTAKPGKDSKGNAGTWHYYKDGRKPVFIAAKR